MLAVEPLFSGSGSDQTMLAVEPLFSGSASDQTMF